MDRREELQELGAAQVRRMLCNFIAYERFLQRLHSAEAFFDQWQGADSLSQLAGLLHAIPKEFRLCGRRVTDDQQAILYFLSLLADHSSYSHSPRIAADTFSCGVNREDCKELCRQAANVWKSYVLTAEAIKTVASDKTAALTVLFFYGKPNQAVEVSSVPQLKNAQRLCWALINRHWQEWQENLAYRTYVVWMYINTCMPTKLIGSSFLPLLPEYAQVLKARYPGLTLNQIEREHLSNAEVLAYFALKHLAADAQEGAS